jgi:hypothetical protein
MSLVPTYAIPDNLPPPVTSGTTIQNFTDIWGDVWIAKNGVNGGNWRRAHDVLYARWFRNTAVNASTTVVILTMDTMAKDDYGLFASPSFVAPVAGWYNFTFQLAISGTASTQWCSARWYYTGVSLVGIMRIHGGATNVFTALCLMQYYMNAGDTMTPYSEASASLAVTVGNHETYATMEYRGTGQ